MRRPVAALAAVLLAACAADGPVVTVAAGHCRTVPWPDDRPLDGRTVAVVFATPAEIAAAAVRFGLPATAGTAQAFRLAPVAGNACVLHLPIPTDADPCYGRLVRHELAHCQHGAWHPAPEDLT